MHISYAGFDSLLMHFSRQNALDNNQRGIVCARQIVPHVSRFLHSAHGVNNGRQPAFELFASQSLGH